MEDELILSEQDRNKLDGVVSKMIANKEPEANIQFVVNDFKQKYSVKKKEPSEASGSLFSAEPSVSVTSAEVPAAFGEIPKFEGTQDVAKPSDSDTPNWYNVAKSSLGRTYEIGKSALLKNLSYGLPLSTPLTREVIDIQAKAAIDKIRDEGPKFEQTFTESIAQGKFGDAALQAEEFLLGTAPLAITSAAITLGTGGAGTPVALALMGGYGAQSAHLDAKGEKFYEDMSPLMRTGYTSAMGGLEVLGEGIGGKILSGAVKKLAAQQITKQAFEQTAKEIAKGALKSNGVAVTEEALAEFTTGFGQSAVDQYARTGDVNFGDAFRQGFEGAAMGAVGGAVFNAPSTVADATALANSVGRDMKNAKARTEISKYKDKLDASSTVEEQDYYAQKLAESIKTRTRNATDDAKFYEYVGTQNPQDLEQFLEIDNEIKRYASMAKVIKDPEATKDIKAKVGDLIQQQKDLESKYSAYDTQKEAGVPSPVVEGEAPIEVQPIEGAGQEAPQAGGILQVPVEEGAEATAETEVIAPIEATVFAAPFYDTKVNNVGEARDIRQGDPYVRNIESIRLSAPLFNVEIDGVDESIGGFVNEAGDKIVEVSNIIRVKGTPEDIQNYAAFLATSSPETQEATIAATYVEPDSETHNIDELTISVSDVDGAIEALKENDIYDFTINDSNNTITFLDFSKGADGDFMDNVGKFAKSLERKNISYEKRDIRAIDSKYIGPREREGIFSRIQETLVQQGQTGTELYKQVEQAIARNQEFLAKTSAPIAEAEVTVEAAVEESKPKESSSRDVRGEILDKEQDSLVARAKKTAAPFIWNSTQKKVRVFKERTSSQISYEQLQINKFTEEMNDLLKKADNETIDYVNDIMNGVLDPNGQRKLEAKPNGTKIFTLANTMRNYIDSFSEDFVNSPEFSSLPKDVVETIIDNFGQYMRGSYRFWKDKKYKPSNKDRREAIAYEYEILRAKKSKELFSKEKLSDEDADKFFALYHDETLAKATEAIDGYIAEIEKIRNGNDFKKLGIISPSSIKLPSDEFTRKKNLPQTIKNLLGEEKDPLIRFIDTAVALSNIKYKGNMLYAISESLGDTKFIKNEVTKAEEQSKEYIQVKDKFSPLFNRYVHKDIFEAITDVNIYQADSLPMQVYLNILQLARKTKVLYNISTWRKQLTGGWYTMMANGVLNKDFILDSKRRAELFAKGETDQETEDLRKIMVDNGLFNQSVNANIIGFTNAIYARAATGNESDYKTYMSRGKDLIKNFDALVGKKYAAVDDYTKLVIFRNEIQSFAKKLYGKKYDSLTENQKQKVHTEAAEFVKQNTPTFSRLPKWYGPIAKSPLGDFLSFEIESIRSLGYNIVNANADIAKAINDKTLSPEQKAEYINSGVKHLAGSTSLFALRMAITTTIASLAMGDDDDLIEDVKNLRPNWMEGHSIIPVDITKEGIAKVYDYSMEDPYGSFFDLLTFRKSIPTYLAGLLGPNMGVSYIMSIYDNKNAYGISIVNSYDDPLTKAYKYTGHTLKSLVVPPFIASTVRDEQARMKEEADKYSPLDAVGRFAARAVIRDYQYNIGIQFYYFTDKFRTKKEEYTDLTGASRENRLAELDEIQKMYKSIINIGIKKGDFKMIDSANKNIKQALKSNEEAYVLYGYKIPEKK